MNKRPFATLACIGVLIPGLCGCTATSDDPVSPDAGAGSGSQADERIRQNANERRIEPDAGRDKPVAGEVPQPVIDAVLTRLEERLQVDRAGFVVREAQSRQFSDGSLGCAEPGAVYTQAIVPGYRVVVEYAGTAYDFRVSDQGFIKPCGESPAQPEAAAAIR